MSSSSSSSSDKQKGAPIIDDDDGFPRYSASDFDFNAKQYDEESYQQSALKAPLKRKKSISDTSSSDDDDFSRIPYSAIDFDINAKDNDEEYHDEEENSEEEDDEEDDNYSKDHEEDDEEDDYDKDNAEEEAGDNIFETISDHENELGDGDAGEEYKVDKNNKGNNCIITKNGRSFNFDSQRKSKDGSVAHYLKCSHRECSVSRTLVVKEGEGLEGGTLKKQSKSHSDSCLASPELQALKKNKKSIEGHASTGLSYKAAREAIIRDQLLAGKSELEIARETPNKKRGASSYSKKLKGHMPENLKTTADVVIPEGFTRKKYEDGLSNERFLLEVVPLTSGSSRKSIVVYASDKMIEALANSPLWLTDGYHSIPDPWKQLLTIHGTVNGIPLPMVYTLAPDKQSDTYSAMISSVMKAICNMLRAKKIGSIKVKNIMADFEKGLRNVFSEINLRKIKRTIAEDSDFISVDVNGCHFHFTESVKDNIKSLCLSKECYIFLETRLYGFVKLLFALAFLKPSDIIPTYKKLKMDENVKPIMNSTASQQKLDEFYSYFESEWLGSVKNYPNGQETVARKFSVYGLQRRTNNDVEAWHSGMSKTLKNCKSTWTFIIALQNENWEKEMLLQQVTDGKVTEISRSKTQKNKEDKIARLASKYDAGELTAFDYVKALQPLMAGQK